MNKLNTNTIQVYIEKLHVRGVSSSDVLKKLQSVDKFFDWAHKSGHIKENIYKQMKGGIDKGMIGAHHDAPVQLVGAKRDLPNYLIGRVTPRPYSQESWFKRFINRKSSILNPDSTDSLRANT
ncbi:hypothetical protein COS12_01115, partial [Candidatus Roizmanbacteria bacterium CG01_land_8_20_14_3_00_33_9]